MLFLVWLTSGVVDENGRVSHRPELRQAYQVPRRVQQRYMKRQHVDHGKHMLQVPDPLMRNVRPSIVGNEWIVGVDLAAEAKVQHAGHGLADGAHAHDAHGLAGELQAGARVALKQLA